MPNPSEPTLFERVRDIIHSYDAAEQIAREMAERQLDNLGLGHLTITAARETPSLPEAVNACATLHPSERQKAEVSE